MSWHSATALATALLLAAGMSLLLGPCCAGAAPSGEAASGAARAVRSRAAGSVGGVVAAGAGSRLRRFPLLLSQVEPPSLALDDDDDSLFELNKRQMSDDYGHMRFGKRGGGENDWAEYGHMRFGRAAV